MLLASPMANATGKRTRIVAYIRVSTEGQAESGLSLEAQRAKVEGYAALYDESIELVDVVIDAGVSAKSLDRPGLRRVLEMLDRGTADGILVAKLDRLTRSVRDLGDLVDRYFAERCSLLSVADSIDTRSAAGRLVLNVLASVSQWEREAIGERTSDALQAKKARGERVGTLPYGFRVGAGGKLEADEAEQTVLTEVRELRATGLSHRAIVAKLAARGFVSRAGRPFAVASVHAMVRGAAA
jgi:site-specific DNA recombinase